MTTPKQIRDAINAILIAQKPKNASNIESKKWFDGQPPPSRTPGFPYGWIEWIGGQKSPPTGTKAEIADNFYIVIVDKQIDQDKAENSIMEFVEAIENALETSPTVGGTVAFSWVSNREKEKIFEGDYSSVAVRITLSTRRRE
jgi:hypothetical protein